MWTVVYLYDLICVCVLCLRAVCVQFVFVIVCNVCLYVIYILYNEVFLCMYSTCLCVSLHVQYVTGWSQGWIHDGPRCPDLSFFGKKYT